MCRKVDKLYFERQCQSRTCQCCKRWTWRVRHHFEEIHRLGRAIIVVGILKVKDFHGHYSLVMKLLERFLGVHMRNLPP